MTESLPQTCRWHHHINATQLEQAACAEILKSAQQAISARGAFHLVLAGGTTPRKVYERLRHAHTDWTSWHIYFGDERCLPIGHVERNNLMAANAWLDHVAIPRLQIHPIPTEEGADLAAKKYAAVVNQVAIFDLVLLGLGEDGHTASLFPEHDIGAAADAPPTLTVLDAPKPPAQRVSLSAHRLSAAHQVLFLVTGNNKSAAVHLWKTKVMIPAAAITPINGVDIFIESV